MISKVRSLMSDYYPICNSTQIKGSGNTQGTKDLLQNIIKVGNEKNEDRDFFRH